MKLTVRFQFQNYLIDYNRFGFGYKIASNKNDKINMITRIFKQKKSICCRLKQGVAKIKFDY